MRKVKFKKWVANEWHIPEKPEAEHLFSNSAIFNGRELYKEGYKVLKTGHIEPDFSNDGFFHCWGVNCEESANGYGNYTVAIVEDHEGLIHEVFPKNIQFLPEPIEESKSGEFQEIEFKDRSDLTIITAEGNSIELENN